MDVKKVQAATFAIKNRLLGYKLLKNPKGASPYQVSMIKNWRGVAFENSKYNYYYTKNHDFSKPNNITQKQKLFITQYETADNNGKKEIKETLYSKYNDKGEILTRSKSTISHESANINYDFDMERDLNSFDYVPVYGKMSFIEELADKIVDALWGTKTADISVKKTNFWQTLKQNLNS